MPIALPGMPLLISPIARGAVITPHGAYNVSREAARGAGAIHKGVDLRVDRGEPVLAALAGTVRVGYDKPVAEGGGGGGNFVGVKSGAYELMYMHLGEVAVKNGDVVAQGQVIGTGGDSGAKHPGTHLHFEIRRPENGERNNIDPTDYLPLDGAAQVVAAVASGGLSAAVVGFAVFFIARAILNRRKG